MTGISKYLEQFKKYKWFLICLDANIIEFNIILSNKLSTDGFQLFIYAYYK
jgi:hypothetical protein